MKTKQEPLPQEVIQKLREWKANALETVKKFIADHPEYTKQTRCMLVYFFKKDIEIVQVSLLCSLVGVSVTYYNQQKLQYNREWEAGYYDVWIKRNQALCFNEHNNIPASQLGMP